jgi:hypothetical protein
VLWTVGCGPSKPLRYRCNRYHDKTHSVRWNWQNRKKAAIRHDRQPKNIIRQTAGVRDMREGGPLCTTVLAYFIRSGFSHCAILRVISSHVSTRVLPES